METCIESKTDSKVARNQEAESVVKTILREKSPPEKSTNFHEIQRNFNDSENVKKVDYLLKIPILKIIIMKIIVYV